MQYTNEELKRIKEDAAYLIDEAEALTYVIDSVPATDKAGGIDSITEMIALIDHAQQTYYRPACERLYSVPNVDEKLRDFRETFSAGTYDTGNAEKLLRGITKNRAGFMDFINKLPLEDLQQKGQINGEEACIASLLEEMIVFERRQLRDVAERILSIDKNLNKSQKNG